MGKIRRLILTPHKNKMCGMYSLALDMAEEEGYETDIKFLWNKDPITSMFLPIVELDGKKIEDYDEVITMIYPMHLIGKQVKKKGVRWIVYDQGIPPALAFHNPLKKLYIYLFNLLNNDSMVGCDEYWWVGEVEQKPRLALLGDDCYLRYNQFYNGVDLAEDYVIYIGRDEEYKNVKWLRKTLEELNIPFVHPWNVDDRILRYLLINATFLATASTWEGFGRPCLEAQSLGIPTVSFDTGAHYHNTKEGYVVTNNDFNDFRERLQLAWYKYQKK